jgi:hypothetical protein
MSRKIARELLAVAKELIAVRGKQVSIRDLPDTIRKALKSLRYGRRDIEVIPSNKFRAGAGFEGNRAVAVVVNIKTGRVIDKQMGSWGGSNMFENREIDQPGDQSIPNGAAVIAGSMGGRGNFLSIYVKPNNLDQLMLTEDEDEVDLTDKEVKALEIMGYKSGYRADYFFRARLGEYNRDNPIIQSLADKGLVRLMSNGITVTTKGKNVRRGL